MSGGWRHEHRLGRRHWRCSEWLEKNVDKQAAKFSEQVEGWFNDHMTRASSWYKRQSQVISLCLALAAAVACNANTFKLADLPWHDASLRAAVSKTLQLRGTGAKVSAASGKVEGKSG